MPRVGFEPTIPVFERAKTVHALDRAAIVIGKPNYTVLNQNHQTRDLVEHRGLLFCKFVYWMYKYVVP
jgi:hypothetical protein